MSAPSPPYSPPRIELIWPGKGKLPRCDQRGSWTLADRIVGRRCRPLYEKERFGESARHDPSLVILGERVDVLETLVPHFPRSVKVAYLDLPRIEIDDKSKAFQGDADHVWATYLSVIKEHIERLIPLMRRDGVIIAHTSDAEEPYVRCVMSELLGRRNHLGTVVWQRHYAPRGMKGMKEFTATHDPIVLFAIDTAALPPVCLERPAKGYSNPDGDPRGEWKAEHKGARTRRARSDFETNVPPYRWELSSGVLPSGLWRLSPLTGIISGIPTEQGAFNFVAAVTDKAGKIASRRFTLNVVADGEPDNASAVPWLFSGDVSSGGDLKIVTTKLPKAVVGKMYSAIVLADGGDPFTGKKRPGEGRYWEFADSTLVSAILKDDCWFGPDGNAMPHPKKRLPPGQTTETVNLQTWWPGRPKGESPSSDADGDVGTCNKEPVDSNATGFTEDATKHLKKLMNLGLIKRFVTTAKPEPLLDRLLKIFSREGDVILEAFGDAAGLTATAIKTGRRAIHLAGHTDSEREVCETCSLPRLRAVISGKDFGLESSPVKPRLRADAYLPFQGGGSLRLLHVGEVVAEQTPPFEYPSLLASWPVVPGDITQAILSLEGFLLHPEGGMPHGISADGHSVAVVLQPDEFLDRQKASGCVTELTGRHSRIVVYYFRSAADFDVTEYRGRDVSFKRVPMDLGG